jgi:predicted Zn finger-like uncharacterized protein
MILTCPNCGTQYVVKDGAIPPEGRQVRCAACKHSWHQDPEEAAVTEAPADEPMVQPGFRTEAKADEAPSEPVEEPVADESLTEATLIEPRSGPEAEQRAYEEAVIEGDAGGSGTPEAAPVDQGDGADEAEPVGTAPAAADWNEPPTAEADAGTDMFSPFAEDEEQPKKRSAGTAIVIVLLLIIAAAAAFWFLAPPSMKAKLGLASAGATPLQLVTTHMDRQHLESGNDLLTLTGRVINPSATEQVVPPIQAQLKSKSGKVVYSWTIQPPAQTLPAGASASFNSAEVSVPPGGDELTITLGDAKASGA